MQKHIYFVRHAESRANVCGLREGGESPLTKRGIAQAHAVARRLARMNIDTICASDMERARHTGEIVRGTLGHNTVHSSPLLRERRNPSIMLGTHYADPKTEKIWDEIGRNYGVPDWRHSDEENYGDLVARGEQALEYLRAVPGERIVAVSHGLFMKVILARVQLGKHADGRIFWDQYVPMKNVENTGIMHLEFTLNFRKTAWYWKLVSWNDHAHLGHGV